MRGSSLARALPLIAGVITRQTRVPIAYGRRPETDGRVIYQPRLPLSLGWRDLAKAIGYTYHEALHIVESDFSIAYDKSPLHAALGSALEDIRIEYRGIKSIPGAKQALSDLVKVMVQDGDEGQAVGFYPITLESSPLDVITYYILYRLRHELLEQPIRERAASARAVVERLLPARILAELDRMIVTVIDCETERDVYELCDEIERLLCPPVDDGGADTRQEEGSRSSTGPDEGPNTASAEIQEQESGRDLATGTPQEVQEGDARQTAEGLRTGQDHPHSSPDAPVLAQVLRGETGEEGFQSESDMPPGSAAQARFREGLRCASWDDVPPDTGEQLMALLQALSDAAPEDAPDNIEWPRIVQVPPSSDPICMDGVAAASNALRIRSQGYLHGVIDANADADFDRRGVKVVPRRMHLVKYGKPVFRCEHEMIDVSSDIIVLLDGSGSMHGIISVAVQCCLAVAMAMNMPGIRCQVAMFRSQQDPDNADVYIPEICILKGWEERTSVLAARAGSVLADGGTPMASAVFWSSVEILRQDSGVRRILLVVTDGDPDDLPQARYVVGEARKSGIHVLGLGIGVNADSVFGEYAQSVRSVGEMPRAMVAMLRDIIR